MGTWFIGAIINVIGSILINLGTNVMKLGHNKRSADLPESTRRPIRKYREWQCGVGLFAIGNVLNFVSFGFAAQSLLAALGSIQFVSNVIFAWFVLHERADRRVIIATAMIVVGCIVLVLFGNHQSAPLTTQELLHLFKNDVYIAYLAWLVVTAGLAFLVYRYGTRKLRREGLGGMSHRWMKALPITYSLFSGMIGTQSVLFSKALSTLLRTTLDGDSQLDSWFFWLVLVLFLCCAYFWVTSLNKALRLFPAVVIVPTMQISWTLFSVVSGGIYYQEYQAFTAFTASMFGLGILLIFAGVYLIAGRPPEHVSPEPLREGPPCPPLDPESLDGSRPISRALSALALPGFGYMQGFSSYDTQPFSPRYGRLQTHSNNQGCSDLDISCGMTRYDSLPSNISKKQLFAEEVVSADLPGADGMTIRAVSVPNMPTLRNRLQLQAVQSATSQSQAWGRTPLLSTSQAVDETTALGAAAIASLPASLDTVRMSAQSTGVMPSDITSSTGFTELLPFAALDASGLSAQPIDVMPFEMPSSTGFTQLLPVAALDTSGLSAQPTDVMPFETPSRNVHSELAAQDTAAVPAQSTDLLVEMPSRNVHSELLSLAALNTAGMPAQSTDTLVQMPSSGFPSKLSPITALDTAGTSNVSTDILSAEMPRTQVHNELSQQADELSGAAPLLDDSQPSSFQLPPGLVWTQNDSFDDPSSGLQPEVFHTGASHDVNHTD